MYYFMDIFYALGLNITKKVCVKYGQMDNFEKKYAKFEGERISHLDKSDTYKPPVNIEEKNSSKDDDYVLSKLFKKSGVHSALQHDVIMNGERGPDFALIGKNCFLLRYLRNDRT